VKEMRPEDCLEDRGPGPSLHEISYSDSDNVQQHRTVFTYSHDSFLTRIQHYANDNLTDGTRIVSDGHLLRPPHARYKDASITVVHKYTIYLQPEQRGSIGSLVNIRLNETDYHPL
jgi:hypothetical protein